MTATERRYAGASDTVLSMDDLDVYGETFSQLSFKEAIDIGILSDYRIITLFISNEEVKKLIDKNAFVKPIGKEWDKETEARSLASLIALRKAMTEYPIHHAVTFHSSIKKAEAFEQSQSVFSAAYPIFAAVQSYHVSGSMPTSKRSKVVDEFAATNKGIITNAKCLTEGIDVPNIDCVLFADPRKSKVDIVQAVGRALRKKDGKEFGYVILPVFTNSTTKEEIIESAEFKEILSTLRALASNDERIIEYFKDISKGKIANKKDSLIQFDIDVQIADLLNEKELIDTIQLTTWNKLAKLSWMPFDEARKYIHSLNLKNQNEWSEFCKSSSRPIDIPSAPQNIYKNKGWKSLGDWLGTGTVAAQQVYFRPYEEAKEFVNSLNFKSANEWRAYCKSGKKPEDIPMGASKTYKNLGWKGMGDWLGTGSIASSNKKFRNFIEAKAYVQSLNLKSTNDWYDFIKSEKKPVDIPSSPSSSYKKEWKGIGDWLGTNKIANHKRKFRSFNDARDFVHSLKLKSTSEWQQFCKSGKKPDDIPFNPLRTYKNSGWIRMGDWLGTDSPSNHNREYRNYEEAKSFIHSLNLKSTSEWQLFLKSKQKPHDIPYHPERIYKEKWISMKDWLGNK